MSDASVSEAMSDPVAQDLLASRNPARISYVGLDGTPRVVPVGFHWNGEALIIGTVPRAPKVAALRERPAVALTIDTGPPAWPPKVLLIRGTATVQIVDEVFPEYILASQKLTPPEEFPAWEEGVRALYDQMARIEVTPTWVRIHDFETRIPKAVEDLVQAKFGQGPAT